MKLTRVCFFGRYSVRGLFITTHVHFSLSPIPCLHLWLGHYSYPFPVQLQRGLPKQFRKGGASAAPEGCSGAVPGGIQSCSRGASRAVPEARLPCCSRGGSELLQRGGSNAAPDGGGASAAPEGGPVLLQRASSAAPEGREHLGHRMDSTGADPACPLLRGYVLTQAIDIFHVPYPLYLLVVKPIDTPRFSTGRGRGEVAGATPLFRVSFGPGPPLQWTLRGPVQHSPRGGRSRHSDPCGKARIQEE